MDTGLGLILCWMLINSASAKFTECPEPWLSISHNDRHAQKEEANLMCLLLTSVQVDERYPLTAMDMVKEELHKNQLKTPDVDTLRDLISVDDDYVAEHEAKIMKEVELQQKILEATEILKEQIKQLRHVQKEEHALLPKTETLLPKKHWMPGYAEWIRQASPIRNQRIHNPNPHFHNQDMRQEHSKSEFKGGRNSIVIDPKYWVS